MVSRLRSGRAGGRRDKEFHDRSGTGDRGQRRVQRGRLTLRWTPRVSKRFDAVRAASCREETRRTSPASGARRGEKVFEISPPAPQHGFQTQPLRALQAGQQYAVLIEMEDTPGESGSRRTRACTSSAAEGGEAGHSDQQLGRPRTLRGEGAHELVVGDGGELL